MKIIKPDPTEVLTRVFSNSANQYCLSIGLVQSFSLHPTAAQAAPGTSLIWPTAGKALGADAFLDEGFPKARGEFLVYGAAYPPANHTAQPLSVKVTLGSLQKNLAVFGERRFNALGMRSAPEPFERMPVSPAHAFGGPSYAQNPMGKGAEESISERTGLLQQALPNIEIPNRLMVSPSDRPEPAGFWALAAAAPERAKLLGRFDDSWLKNRWPHIPSDTDEAYFQTAPQDQRLNGFFRGDEPVTVQNMHAQFPVLETNLPGMRGRIFVAQRMKNNEQVFKELLTKLETVWLLPDQLIGLVLYRAVVAISEFDAADIDNVYAELEALCHAPESLEQHYKKFLVRRGASTERSIKPTTEPEAALDPTQKSDDILVEAKLPEPKSAAPPPPQPAPDIELERSLKELKDLNQDADTKLNRLKQSGVDLSTLEQQMNLPETNLSAIEAKKLIDESAARMRALFKNSGKTESELIASLKAKPQSASIAAILEKTPGGLLGLMDSVQQNTDKLFALEEAPTKAAKERQPTSPESTIKADELAKQADTERHADLPRDRQWVIDRHARGESFVEQDLSHLDLSGLDLCDADFTGAQLADVNFAQARLERTRFDDALLSAAKLTGANLSAASLKGVSAGKSDFKQCNLSRADLRKGDFSESNFEQANLDYSDLKFAIFSGSNMNGLSALGSVAEKASFDDCALTEANFTDARLKGVSFYGSVMCGVNLTDALCQRTDFSGADLSKGKLSGAGLQDSEATSKTSFARAIFIRADLSGASWAAPCLNEADFNEAIMNKADLTGASMQRARLIRVVARETCFDKVDFESADLTGINLFEGALRGAKLNGCKLQMANLYGVDFLNAQTDGCDMTGSDIERTILSARKRLT